MNSEGNNEHIDQTFAELVNSLPPQQHGMYISGPFHQLRSHPVTSDLTFNVLDAEGLKAHEKKLETNKKKTGA